MNNRFKFRAWHKDAKQMLYPEQPQSAFLWLAEGQPVVVMQWTGLKDKNGREIYEGDILEAKQFRDNAFDEISIESIFHVDFDDRGFFVARAAEDDDDFYFLDDFEFEIIGNIYEHSHLLEKE